MSDGNTDATPPKHSVSSEVKVLARHGSIYGLANVLGRIISFIMLPIYTRYLTPADYGTLELIYLTTNIIEMVIGLRIEAAVSRFYFDFKEVNDRNTVVSTATLGYGALAAAMVLLLTPFSGFMATHILDAPDQSALFTIAIITLGVGIVNPIGFAYFRVIHASVTLMTFRVVTTLVTLSLNIYFVVVLKQGVYGILYSSLIAAVLTTIVMMIYVLRRTGFRINWGVLKEMIKFGLPLIPSNMAAYMVHASDKYFIKEYVDMSSAGLYSVGYKIGTLVNSFVTSPFTQIWTPRRFETFTHEGAEKLYARIFTYFVTLSLFVSLMISIMAKEIIIVTVDHAYWPAYKVVPIITLSYTIFSFHYHFNVGIMMKKATKYLAYVNVSNGLLNLLLNLWWIKYWGIWGAAYATLVCFIFKVVMTYYYSNRFFKIEVEWRRVATLFAVAFILYFAGVSIDTGSIWLDLALKPLVGVCYVLLLYFSRFFTGEEIKTFKRIVKTRKFDFA
jgi:O-antigen/teichoic acid export membrane protein